MDDTNLLLFITRVAATSCGLVVAARAINVVRHMDFHNRQVHYLLWLAFGLSYTLLAVSAAGAIIALWQGQFAMGNFAWVVASAGLILFDRRRSRNNKEPNATIHKHMRAG